ncbi:MAG TPA: TolC family protein [Chthoniobacterales bacterium]
MSRSSPKTPLIALILTVFCGAAALGKDGPPPSPEKPWAPPKLGEYEADLARGNLHEEPVAIDPKKTYTLPELIDIAQRSNPDTRVAWERARQAAAAVGLGQSAYFPYLVASAGAGYERAFIPFPKLKVNQQQLLEEVSAGLSGALTNPSLPDVSVVGGGTLTTEVVASRAAVSVKWLLLDFGERDAMVDAAKQRLMMANVGFNAMHQKIVFGVTQRFYEFNTARQRVAVALSALRAAETVGQAAQARLDNGLATKPEVLQAEQQTAQASFDLEAARGAESNAQVALVESLGIPPTASLQVADIPPKLVPANPERSLDTLIDRALAQRPDLVAKLAAVRASRAEMRKVRAEYFPKVALDAHAGWLGIDVSAENSDYFGGDEPVYGVGIAVEVPIFDGFARANKLRIAQSELRATESELAGARDAAVREVWKASTDFETALRKQESAVKLLTASESAFAASLEAYRQGLGTYVDVVNAQHNLAAARSIGVDTRSAIFTGAAALALSVGDLAKPVPSPIRKK